MRVADYIADFFVQQGIKDIFLVSGGGMMYLLDGLACNKNINVICTHHEQAAAMAGVGYAKLNEKPAVVYVTTGCGATNAITGLLDAWQDNVPVIFVSGQSKRKESIRGSGVPLRQFGVQEVDIFPVVQSLTKYSVFIDDPSKVRQYLVDAWQTAISGRPGPVWLDVPLDVQAAEVLQDALLEVTMPSIDVPTASAADINYVHTQLEKAKRPIIVVGQGVRIARAGAMLQKVIEKYNVPIVASRLGIDILPTDHYLNIGRIGNKGDRAGNFALQNADFVLAIGSRLSVSSTGHEYEKFARNATLAVVDIDLQEHTKKTVHINRFIHSDAAYFLDRMLLHEDSKRNLSEWVQCCQRWKTVFSVFRLEYNKPNSKINMYRFMEVLNGLLPDNAVVVSDAGSTFYVVSQALNIQKGQRYVTSGGQADMGYGLPAVIGASVARKKGDIIGIIGDGSFQMNIQELQTIVHYQLPVKLFVMNNDGYLAIRTTQNKFFEGRLLGTDKSSGVSFPALRKIAAAYGIPFKKIKRTVDLETGIRETIQQEGPVLCEVCCLANQDIVTVSSMQREDGTMVSKPLEDMYPFLDRQQFLAEMIVDPLEELKC